MSGSYYWTPRTNRSFLKGRKAVMGGDTSERKATDTRVSQVMNAAAIK